MRLNLSSQIVLNEVPESLYRPHTAVERAEVCRMEKVHTDVYANVQDGAHQMATDMANIIRQCASEKRPCTMLLGTGTSLTPVFEELVALHKEGLSFAHVVVFNGYEYYPYTDEHNCSSLSQLKMRFLDQVDILPENIHTPDNTIAREKVPAMCQAYEQAVMAQGQPDIALFGIGRQGNLAINEPGAPLSSRTRLILMDRGSRHEISKSFGTGKMVAPYCVTMGISTILQAKHVFISAWGDEKADIVKATAEGAISEANPSSFLQTHASVCLTVDLPAAAMLTRLKTPWMVTSCQWTDKQVRAALVDLCLKLGKPLLKLTDKDYRDNNLSELLTIFGSAYQANIKVFNELQHTITGWPGGKPNADDTYRPERAFPFPKRVIVFSPHPDDDVISMGGTLRRLVQQGHEVHVAYETSGNIAVGDEEVTRFMHFVNGFNQIFCDSKDEVITAKYKEIKSFLSAKKENEPDTLDILKIKGLIRRGEARTASTYNDIPLSRVHFLDLPFYESGAIEKLPMTEKDVRIIMQLLDEVKPHQIYVAGDLADPHGTHRKCTDAVMAAIDEFKNAGAEWLKDCRIWMYRGAWAEWEIENIEMCVPISPEELRAKRNSILKHSSQMESAPFLGNDERLFWQRAEDRNQATARLYDNLGLASYEAMEAFVEYKPL